MGQRSQTETLVGIYQAFLRRRTWKQAELAKHVGIGTEPLRRMLYELAAAGMRLDREEDHPHVYWSVPKDWFPGSILFAKEEVPELLRQLRRLPNGQGRTRILHLVLSRLPDADPTANANTAIIARTSSTQEDLYLSVAEDAASKRVPLFMRYHTQGRGDANERYASVHRVHVGPPAQFIATCHRSGTLKRFRVENIIHARLDEREPYRASDEGTIDAYESASLDGFHEGGAPTVFSFFVRNPEARWVRNNLLDGMKPDSVGDGVRVTVHTTALGRLARFVVGLGAAATPETPALAREVAELARGALATASASAQDK